MSWLVQAFPQLLAAQWLLGIALVGLVELALVARPRTDAGTRQALWTAVLSLLCLLPFLVLLLAPRSETVAPTPGEAPSVRAVANEPVGAVAAVPPSGAPSPRELKPTSRLPLEPERAVLLAWLALVVLRFSNLGRDLLELRALIRRARPAPANTERRARALLQAAPGSSSVRLVVVDDLRSPAVLGPLAQTIALPPRWLDGVSLEAQRSTLLHELAHCRRRDPLAVLARRMLGALLPLNPAAWWAQRQADLESECACDDWAMLQGGREPEVFARSLLECAQAALEAPYSNHSLASAFLGRQSSLHRRLVHMTSNRQHRPQLAWKTLAALGAVLLFSAVTAASAWPGLPPVAAHVASPLVAAQPTESDYPSLSADSSRLYQALRSGDWKRTQELLESGSEVNQIWPGDGSPLIVAARHGDLEALRLLLELGAEPDLGVAGDGTALINAASNGHPDAVELLLSYGADIDHHGHGGDGNPLIAASMAGNLPLVRLLIDRGARIDIHIEDDDTPLINAVQQGEIEVVEYLLAQGADPNLSGDADRRSGEIRTPLNQALRFEHEEIERLLRQAGAH